MNEQAQFEKAINRAKSPRYVQHDGIRWRVAGVELIDGRAGYMLSAPGQHPVAAFQDECIPDDRPRTRRLKGQGYVLEFSDRGLITIREAGRRKRFTTSLAAIYSMTVKAHALYHRTKPRRR